MKQALGYQRMDHVNQAATHAAYAMKRTGNFKLTTVQVKAIRQPH